MIAGVILLADQLTKAWIVAGFDAGQSVPFIAHLLHLTYIQNTGAAFGLFRGQQALFIACSLAVIVWILWEWRKKQWDSLTLWAAAFILGGAVGNLIDRLRLGYVIDFLDLRIWPVFNVGDSAITVGVVLILWQTLFGGEKQGFSTKQ